MRQSSKAKVQPPKATALPRAINPIEDPDDDLTPPPETPPREIQPPKPRRSRRTAANVSIAMMIEQGPKTYRATLDAESTKVLAKQKQRVKSTTTIAIGKRTAAIDF